MIAVIAGFDLDKARRYRRRYTRSEIAAMFRDLKAADPETATDEQ